MSALHIVRSRPAAPPSALRSRAARWYWLPPAALTLAFGLVGLGHRQPWEDEYASWWAATLSWPDLGGLLHHTDLVLAPYYVLLHLWIDLFGDSASALRLPSVLAMAGTAGLLVQLGRRVLDPWAALTAGLIFAVLPATTRYAQEARPYAFAELAAVAGTLLLLRALIRPTVGRWTAYATTLPLMAAAHLVTLLVLTGHAAAVLAGPQRRARAWRWTLATGAGLLPVLPFAYGGQAQSRQVGWISGSSTSLGHLPQQLFLSQATGWTLIVAALFGAGHGLLRGGRARRAAHAVLLAWAALPVLLLWAGQGVINLFLGRYLLCTVPAWALLAASGVCTAARLLPGREISGYPRRMTFLAPGVAAALLLLSAPDLARVRADPLPGEPDWRAAAHAVSRQADPGDGFAVNGYRLPRLALAYQLRGTPVALRDIFQGTPAQSLGSFDPGTCAEPDRCAQGTDRIWLFSTQPKGRSFSAMPAAVAHLLATRYRVIEVMSFPAVRVLLLVHVD
jgi:mannosyltransferase